MEGFTVEGTERVWPDMFAAAISGWPEEKFGKDLLAAAKKLAQAATQAMFVALPEGNPNADPAEVTPYVRVQVLASNTGGFGRAGLDVYVTPR